MVWLPAMEASRGKRKVTRAKSDATATSNPLLVMRSKNCGPPSSGEGGPPPDRRSAAVIMNGMRKRPAQPK
jgi:hypothetical protein